MVMRITLSEEALSLAILKLEGSVSQEWAALLERESADRLRSGRTVRLDLTSITYVDRLGLEVLGRLSRAGVEILCPPGPVASVLEGEGIGFTHGTDDVNGEPD